MNKEVVLFHPAIFSKRDKGMIAKSCREGAISLSLLAIAGPLIKAKYKVTIIDQLGQPNWRSILISSLKNNPTCVGITAMTGMQILNGLKASRIIKQKSNIPIVWGGIHPTLLPQQTVENEYIDIVVEGEGEETFLELVEALHKKYALNQIKGLWYKENGQIKRTLKRGFVDLNKQPFLPYYLLNYKQKKTVPIFTSRGCHLRCSYCYSTLVHQRKWRALTPEDALKRIKSLMTIYENRIDYLIIEDDNFFVDLKRAKSIIQGLMDFNIPWVAKAHINSILKLDHGSLKLIEKSNCERLLIGIESGSQRILNLIKKDITVSDVISINRRLAKFNFAVGYHFMLGIPTETMIDIKNTFSLIATLLNENKKAIKNLNIYAPYPGTELYNLTLECGFYPSKELAGWAGLNIKTLANRPWLNNKRKRILEMLLFCSHFLDENRTMASPLLKALFMLYRPIAKSRIRNYYCGFPLDIKLGKSLGFLC